MNGKNANGKKKLTTFDLIDQDTVIDLAQANEVLAVIVNTDKGRTLLIVSREEECDSDSNITSDDQSDMDYNKKSKRLNLVKTIESFAYVDECGGNCPAGQKCQLVYEDGYWVWACR
jgi:hypothetical protein